MTVSATYASSRLSTRTLRSSLPSALAIARGLGHTASVDSWARVNVSAHLGVDVDKNTWISVLVRARQRHASWGCATAACNGDLVARRVELGSVEPASNVQGNDFGAQQIVAWGDVRWDLDVDLEGC